MSPSKLDTRLAAQPPAVLCTILIKYLRSMKQIWQHLKNKWIKYLFETIAIIIGIFGAFSLDNWNNSRLDRKEEILILKEISRDLSAGLDEINASISQDKLTMQNLKIIIQQMTNDLPYHDSLNQYFYNLVSFNQPVIPSSAFATLKSKGFGLISNSNLRRDLVEIFEQRLPKLSESLIYDSRLRHEQYHLTAYIEKFSILSRDLGDPIDDNYIESLGTNSVAVPVNYDELIKDQKYENLLREIYNNSQWMTNYKNNVSMSMKILIDDIEEEVARLQ
jgi:hypothetical protein